MLDRRYSNRGWIRIVAVILYSYPPCASAALYNTLARGVHYRRVLGRHEASRLRRMLDRRLMFLISAPGFVLPAYSRNEPHRPAYVTIRRAPAGR